MLLIEQLSAKKEMTTQTRERANNKVERDRAAPTSNAAPPTPHRRSNMF